MKYDVVIFGGGTSGVASAYIASKYGLNVLLIEKTDVLGGAITRGLVIPTMKVDSQGINTEFFNDLKTFAKKYNAQHTYKDENEGWFNPELLKIVLDDMLASVKCTVLFNTQLFNANYSNIDECFDLELKNNMLSLYIESKYIVDSTSDGKIFKILNYNFQNNSEKNQAPSLRFNMSNINIIEFASWLEYIDKDTDVTSIERSKEQIYLSTACTWDTSKNWALAPFFRDAIDKNILEINDTAYFQVFSIPSMPNSLAFNCPRIILSEGEDISDPFVYSRALKQGRERIYRLSNFCKKYFKGFENAYISHISDMLGVRESVRVKCKYTITTDDIISPKNFDNIAFACDYPIDIHSNNKDEDKLEKTNKTYYIPIEALISENNDKVYAVGRHISADFEAQAALRTQMSCFSMGEAASKDIIKKIKN